MAGCQDGIARRNALKNTNKKEVIPESIHKRSIVRSYHTDSEPEPAYDAIKSRVGHRRNPRPRSLRTGVNDHDETRGMIRRLWDIRGTSPSTEPEVVDGCKGTATLCTSSRERPPIRDDGRVPRRKNATPLRAGRANPADQCEASNTSAER